MKKYMKLTASEAIGRFILKDSTLAPGSTAEISETITDVEGLQSGTCVTITLPTHRTRPDYDMDVIRLKNLVDEAEKQLIEKLGKRGAEPVMENIRQAQQTIDPSLNIDGLVLYANASFSTVIKLPLDLDSEVLIGDNFDLRSLLKAMQQNSHYYIITVSRRKVRLIEALNKRPVAEVDNADFPYENTEFYGMDPRKEAQAPYPENLEKEFYNFADKRFRKYYLENPIPVVLLGDVKSVSYYEEIMDDKRMVVARVNGNYDLAPPLKAVEAVYPAIAEYRALLLQNYTDAIGNAISANLMSNEPQYIAEAIEKGNIDTLFLKENYLPDEKLRIIEHFEASLVDLMQKMIGDVLRRGGKVIFVPDAVLRDYGDIVLIRRY